jgi:outer membrane protein assembly factor BamB
LDWFFKASDGEDNESPFSSPMLFELHGVPQLIVLERNRLCGLNPQNGQRLWSVQVPAFRGMNILTPTQVGSGLLTATYGGKTHLFEPSQSEDGNWQVNQKWIQNFQGYMSSPLVVGSHAYLHGRSGRMVCLDTQAGQVLWTSSESFGKYCSQVTNGERMLCLSHDGNLRLLKINPEHCQIMDETRVSQEETWAHLAVAGHSLILRSLHSLCIFDWKSQGVQ